MTRAYFFLITSLISNVAMANIGLMPSESDVTVKHFLSSIFGSLVNMGGGLDPMSEAISKFNAFILTIGGVLLAYGLVAGTAQTAHDGEILGKRWSSMWVPIRTSLGIAAIVPLGSGYAAVQYVVMWLALQGVGAANLVWNSFSAQDTSTPRAFVLSNKEAGAKVAATVLKQELCVAILNAELQAARQPDGTNYSEEAYGKAYVRDLNEKANLSKPLVCGSYRLTQTEPNKAGGKSWFNSTIDPVSFNKQINSTHISAFRSLQNRMKDLAQKVCGERCGEATLSNDAIAKQFEAILKAYNDNIAKAIASAIGSSGGGNDVVKNASRDGWGMAGAFYMKYVYVQNELSKEAIKYPLVIAPSGLGIPFQFRNAWNDYKSRSNDIAALVKYKDELGIERQLEEEKENESDSLFKKFIDKITSSLGSAQSLGKSFFADKNPILAAKDFGDYVFNRIVTTTIVAAGAAFAGSLAGSVTIMGNSINLGQVFTTAFLVFAPLWFAITGGLLAFSAMLAFYLPVLPFILWFGVVIGWLVLVAEAIIAAPLWAIMHVHPDGDGIVGKSGQGYSLVLALMLRPVLAIMGLIASIILIDPVGRLFAQTFWAAFDFGQGKSFQGIAAFVAALAIFTIIFVSIVQRLFSLIHLIPDQILRWIGGPSGELGQTAQQLGQAGMGTATAIGGVVGAVSGQSASVIQNYKQLREQANAAREQEEGNRIAKISTMSDDDHRYGYGMGKARMDGNDAVNAAYKKDWSTVKQLAGESLASLVKENLSPANIAEVRKAAEINAYDSIHGDGAYKTREEYDKARAKYGLSEANASDYNKLMEDRAKIKSRKETFDPETYVQNILKRQSNTSNISNSIVGKSTGNPNERATDNPTNRTTDIPNERATDIPNTKK